MQRRKTPEQYIKECKQKGYDLPIEDYKGTKTKIKHKCSKGHIYEQAPTHHLKGSGCPICNGGMKYNNDIYVNKCKEMGYDLPVEPYVDSNTKIKHKCSKGHVYKQTPSSHLRGKGCYYCAGNKKKSPKSYYNECKERGYDLPIEDYVNNKTKIKHKCKKCDNVYLQRPHDHLTGNGCPYCSGAIKRINKDYYLEQCKKNGLDLPMDNYIDKETKLKHRCNKGHIYYQTPHNHLQGYACPVCKESHGEKFIRNYLVTHSIMYESQKTFGDLKDIAYLSYDFYLPKQKILIEYQGQQHYESVNHFGGKEKFQYQQLHDNLKKEYAKKNGYKLLELHYSLDTQEKVNKYLERRIKSS